MFVFGLATLAMNAFALAVWWVAGMKLFLSIVGPPAIPPGVKPFAGSWPAWVMYLMIAWRSIANAIARRWFTSDDVLDVEPVVVRAEGRIDLQCVIICLVLRNVLRKEVPVVFTSMFQAGSRTRSRPSRRQR